MANNVVPDQTAPSGAICSESAIFAEIYASICPQYLDNFREIRFFHSRISHRKNDDIVESAPEI